MKDKKTQGKKSVLKRVLRYTPLYLMMLPGIIYLVINNYMPMTGIVMAFKRYNFQDGIYRSPNVGFENLNFYLRQNDAGSLHEIRFAIILYLLFWERLWLLLWLFY